MAVTATINDVARVMLSGSLSVNWRLGERGNCSATFQAPAAVPAVGQRLGIFVDGVRVFGGTFDEVVEVLADNPTVATLNYLCRASSWEQRLDVRLIKPQADTSEPSSTFTDLSGTCNTSGTAVTWVSGDEFDKNLKGTKIVINAVTYTVSDVASTTSLTLTGSAGSQSGVAFSWTPTAGNIARSLVTNWAGGENITLATIEDGDDVGKFIFDHIPVSQALDQVAKATDKVWYIDPDLNLYFTDRTTTAGAAVTTSNALRDGYEVQRTREDLENDHYHRISFNAFDPESNTFVGDGSKKTFWLGKPAAIIQSMQLELPGEVIEATFGVRGVDSGKDFYWAPGERKITQDATHSGTVTGATNASPIVLTTSVAHGLADGHRVTVSGVGGNTAANGSHRVSVPSDTTLELIGSDGNGTYTSGGTTSANAALTSNDVLTVVYRNQGGDVVNYEDSTAITARATAEGTSGRYEKFEEDTDNVDAVGTLAYITALVDERKNVLRAVHWQTDVTSYRVGQLVAITNSTHGLSSANHLIDEVSARDVDGKFLRFQVRAIDGTRLGGWREFFKALKRDRRGVTGATSVSGGTVVAGSGGGSTENFVQEHTLSASSTEITSTATTPAEGKLLVVLISQDGTGGRQITWSSDFQYAPVDIDTTASTVSIFQFIGRSTAKWAFVSLQTGLS